MGIAVRDAESGGPIGYGRAFARWLVTAVFWALLSIPGIVDALSPLWNDRSQAWHDRAAGTVVVRV